jgi:hypothetical protein
VGWATVGVDIPRGRKKQDTCRTEQCRGPYWTKIFTAMSERQGTGTITKCLTLRHFESFPQVDVWELRWHFIHPLAKFRDHSKIIRKRNWARNGNNEVASLGARWGRRTA